MFYLLKKIVKITIYSVLVMFLVLSLLPYLFSLNHPKFDKNVLPFDNSHFEINAEHFVHYRVFKPEKTEHKVFLLHGFSGSTFSYHKLFDSLVKHNCLVIAADLPPFGYSVKNKSLSYSDTISINLFQRILLKTDSVYNDTSRWVIAGHSMGVMYAAKFITRYPELFNKQVFIDGYYGSQDAGSLSVLALYPPFMRLADVALERYFLKEKKFKELLNSAYARQPTAEEIQGYMQPFAYENSGSSVMRWTGSSQKIKVDESFIRTRSTLVIWGKKDTWITYKEESFKLNEFKDVTFKMIDEAGHIPMETHADEVNRFLINFIQQ